jgi:uncharacterized protein YcfJ
MEVIMKLFAETVSLAFVGALIASQAMAQSDVPSFKWFEGLHKTTARVLDTSPVYSGSQTRQKEVCEKVRVPIYGGVDQNQRTGNALAGAVIGGILGNMAAGNKAGTTAGAILGAAAGANAGNREIVGYRLETQCNVVDFVNDHLRYYKSRVRVEGDVYIVHTQHRLEPGSSVKMYVAN